MNKIISIIVPVYNAKNYLRRFISSVEQQTFSEFEVVCVNDASTDGCNALLDAWAISDPRVVVLQLERNMGAGAARNRGLGAARGELICFADPDDILPPRSLEARYVAYKANNAIVRACHQEIAGDNVLRHERPPQDLRGVFSPEAVARRVGVTPFLSAHWAWLLPANLLRREGILHEEGTHTAEDIRMLVRLFFHVHRMVWIPDVVYHWMKRDGSLSTSVYGVEHYDDYLNCVDAFYRQALPRNQSSLADIFCSESFFCYLPHVLGQSVNGQSNDAHVRQVVRTAARICTRHGVFQRCLSVMENHPLQLAGIRLLWQTLHDQTSSGSMTLALGKAYAKNQRLWSEALLSTGEKGGRNIIFDAFDAERGLLRARYLYRGLPPQEQFVHGIVEVAPAYAKNRRVNEGQGRPIYERILWLPLPEDADVKAELLVDGQDSGLHHRLSEVRDAFASPPLDDGAFPEDIRVLRRMTRSQAMRKRFCGAWFFVDKDTEADDNAEHLYRWVLHHHPEINAWFVLNRDSRDWRRLEAEGFRLVPFGGVEHRLLHLLGSRLISSQMDRYIFTRPDEHFFSDFPKPKFVCLPHGVTKDDVSEWFNGIPFDLFIAATRQEISSITADGTPYIMTEKEVRLGGFPRYDKWMEPATVENMIFVMPTWRANLVGAWDGKGQRRELNPKFYSSRYVHMWQDFFERPQLKKMLEQYCFHIVFFAHPCCEDYVTEMPFPDFVEKRSKRDGSIVDVMKKAKIMITDFSSVAYDMAYMRRPVIYYQYESKSEFVKSQQWKNGYIDYNAMGFGPVCCSAEELLSSLEKTIKNGCIMEKKYADRIENTFCFHDDKCCKRAFDYIVGDSKKYKR